MTEKTLIVEAREESPLPLPSLLADALAANDRLKLDLTLLQDTAAR